MAKRYSAEEVKTILRRQGYSPADVDDVLYELPGHEYDVERVREALDDDV